MIKKIKLILLIIYILLNVKYTFADLPGYTCKLHGTIIGFDEYFIKPDCFKLTKIRVRKDNGDISEFTATTRYHDTCFKSYFYGGYKNQDVLNLPNFIPDYKQYGKTYFFKIEEESYGMVYANTGGVDKSIVSKIPSDIVGEIPVRSIMSGYYNDDSLNSISKIRECDANNVIISSSYDTIKVEKTDNLDTIKYIIIGLLLGFIFTIVLIYILKINKKYKICELPFKK